MKRRPRFIRRIKNKGNVICASGGKACNRKADGGRVLPSPSLVGRITSAFKTKCVQEQFGRAVWIKNLKFMVNKLF